jgi:hypothetical protein
MDNDLGKDNTFDIDNDPEFNANFYKNIEKALDNVDLSDSEPQSDVDVSKTDDEQKNNEEKQENAAEGLDDFQVIDLLATQKSEVAAAASAEALSENNIDDELMDINFLLAKQISDELDSAAEVTQKKEKYFTLQNTILLTVLCLIGFCFFFGFTKPGNGLLMDMGINIGGTIWDTWTKD